MASNSQNQGLTGQPPKPGLGRRLLQCWYRSITYWRQKRLMEMADG